MRLTARGDLFPAVVSSQENILSPKNLIPSSHHLSGSSILRAPVSPAAVLSWIFLVEGVFDPRHLHQAFPPASFVRP